MLSVFLKPRHKYIIGSSDSEVQPFARNLLADEDVQVFAIVQQKDSGHPMKSR